MGSGAEASPAALAAGVPAVGVKMAVDGDGEILARSNNVFEGYWAQPAETAKAIADGGSTPATAGTRRARTS